MSILAFPSGFTKWCSAFHVPVPRSQCSGNMASKVPLLKVSGKISLYSTLKLEKCMLTYTTKHALLKSHTHETNKISGFSNGFEKKVLCARTKESH
jgi:hypothetical protein